MAKPTPPDDPVVYVCQLGFTERRLDVMLELMRITGKSTPEQAIRLAIWHYAHFQNVENLHHDDL